jgi:hypothetical protein|tara:strand:- start:814 stop:1248 length:435 start_codon:yes stop_codon:yes gene_type:complete
MESLDLKHLSKEEILDFLSKIVFELKHRGIMKTNNIVAELGEYYAIKKLNLNSKPKGFKDYDAEKDGIRYEIKTRQKVSEPYRKSSSQYRLNDILKDYDFLILVMLNDKFVVDCMYKFPRKMFNKDTIPITKKLLSIEEVEKIV